MSTETVLIGLGCLPDNAQALEGACIRYGIETTWHKSIFIGQIAVETGGFRATRESMNYSVEGLINGFGRHRISVADAQKYGRIDKVVNGKKTVIRAANQVAIANILYGGEWGRKNLGNTELNDGWNFRGGGDKQLTGRANWTNYSMDTYGDLRVLENPTLIELYPDKSYTAGWFWQRNKLGDIASQYVLPDDPKSPEYDSILRSTVTVVTKKVNGGDKGLEDRIMWTKKALQGFNQLVL